METSRYSKPAQRKSQRRKRNIGAGFSILEVIIAIAVLAIGLSAMAALVASSLSGTERARFMALATTLTSEKLEDLNRWPSAAPQVAPGGSLTSDGAAGGLNYFDDVDLSNTSGQISETTATSTGFSSVIHYATGVVTPSSNTTAPSSSGTIAFHRRWLIESNPVVGAVTLTGSRRITVVVTMSNQNGASAISFQMSTVRP